MLNQSLIHTYRRYRTLQTDRIKALPLVILMPHSAYNCRCVMCDIWKGNKRLKQLEETDIKGLLKDLKALGTRQVVFSGGEALLNPNFFRFCELLQSPKMHLILLSTGLTLQKHAASVVKYLQEVIVSLDGEEETHNAIRNVPDAYQKLREGVQAIKKLAPSFKITARCVIHKWNFRNWSLIVQSAKNLGLDSISFLPADVTSSAFNRAEEWDNARQNEVLIPEADLEELQAVISTLIADHKQDFESGFIVESPAKIKIIGQYYKAVYGLDAFPRKKCNAPWVSTVVEASGAVKPCFFHEPIGNIRNNSLRTILNASGSIQFRKTLKAAENETCKRCVCSLYLPPHKAIEV